MDTTLFVEHGGKTTVTQIILGASPEAREAILKSGMESGVEASYDRLEKLLVSAK